MPRQALAALLLALCCGPLRAGLTLEIARIEHESFRLERLGIDVGEAGGAASLSVGALHLGERVLRNLRVRCPHFTLQQSMLDCRGGALAVPGLLPRAAIDLRFDVARREGALALRLNDGGRLDVRLRADGAFDARARDLRAGALVAALGLPEGWQLDGRFDGRADYSPGGAIRLAGQVREGGFSSADGLRAGEHLTFDANAEARANGRGWEWNGRLAWGGGEAYLHPLYLRAGAVIDASGRLTPDALAIERATLDMEGVRSASASLALALPAGQVEQLALSIADADLAVIGPRFIAPLMFPGRADGIVFSGHASAGLVIEDGALQAFDAAFDDAGFGFADGGLAFGPLNGSLPWRAAKPTQAQLNFGGGRWQKLALGPFELVAQLDGPAFAIETLAVPVLDSRLVFDRLALRRDAHGWHGSGGLVVEPVSMRLLTEAVGLPPMSGVLSASLPRLRIEPGEAVLDGALVISLFDGYLQATGLRILEPFGASSRLYADIEARHLDLAQLTETFSFGSVTGFIDADLRGLELAHWRPVRFDARVAGSEGAYPRRISQRAVQNISALGGGGAAAAIQRSFLGFFDTFGYRDIGWSCVLSDGVCLMGGIPGSSAAGGGYTLVRGGGIPALNVIGYNRRVDWQELVDRLQAAIASNAGPVIR